LRPSTPEKRAYASTGDELPLSGSELADLMVAVLSRGRAFRFRAKGSSMLPFVCDGDVLTLQPLGNTPPRLGELVAFMHPQSGRPTIHRVVRRRSDACLMRGDAVHAVDGWVARASMLGRVTAVCRAGRQIRLGLGAERVAIAATSRWGLWRYLSPALWWCRRIVRGARRAGRGNAACREER